MSENDSTSTTAPTFHTDNIGLVAAMALQGINPIDRAIGPRDRFVFHFANTEHTRDVRNAYESGALNGPLIHFDSIVRSLALSVRRR